MRIRIPKPAPEHVLSLTLPSHASSRFLSDVLGACLLIRVLTGTSYSWSQVVAAQRLTSRNSLHAVTVRIKKSCPVFPFEDLHTIVSQHAVR